jgi:anti-sigma factor RsiW
MTDKHFHVSDEVLAAYGSAELPAAQRGKARAHLAICAECSARLEAMSHALAEFSDLYRHALDAKLPPATGSREALRSQLADLKLTSRPPKSRLEWVASAMSPSRGGYVAASILLVLVLMVAVYRREIESRSRQLSASLGSSIGSWTEPKTDLTPGATLPLTTSQVCAATPARLAPTVPVSLRRRVLAIYGVSGASSDTYEVDYLITPELGGATDIRNLWPEPYDTAWNAHVKDQLEERLRHLVCQGDVDLTTAQQDISRDWISAYRKYFHTDRPITNDSIVHRL